ncbi:hypothetical protein BaRGS_00039217, partial [Batillaria attramentaria]
GSFSLCQLQLELTALRQYPCLLVRWRCVPSASDGYLGLGYSSTRFTLDSSPFGPALFFVSLPHLGNKKEATSSTSKLSSPTEQFADKFWPQTVGLQLRFARRLNGSREGARSLLAPQTPA